MGGIGLTTGGPSTPSSSRAQLAACAFADKPTQEEAGEKNHHHSAHYDPSEYLFIHANLLYLCFSLERSGAMQSGSLLEGQRETFERG